MKNSKLKILCAIFLVAALVACEKEEDNYESKNIPVGTVFDDIKIEDSDQREETVESSEKADKDKEKDESEDNLDSSEESEENETDETDENTEHEPRFMATSVNANLRSSASQLQNNVVTTVPPNTSLMVLEENIGTEGQWARVEYNNQTYYIMTDLLYELY